MKISKLRNARKCLLIKAINQAFDGVELEDGVSLHETRVIDDYGSKSARQAARRYDTQTRWQDVPINWLADLNGLSFFDAKGLRFYLPAYMVWTLENFHTTTSNAAEGTIYRLCPHPRGQLRRHALALYQIFNEMQSRTICGFLRFMQDELDQSSGTRIQWALDDYWGKFCLENDYFRN